MSEPTKVTQMETLLLQMLPLVRAGLSRFANMRLKNNNFKRTPYTDAVENVITALTNLHRFH